MGIEKSAATEPANDGDALVEAVTELVISAFDNTNLDLDTTYFKTGLCHVVDIGRGQRLRRFHPAMERRYAERVSKSDAATVCGSRRVATRVPRTVRQPPTRPRRELKSSVGRVVRVLRFRGDGGLETGVQGG